MPSKRTKFILAGSSLLIVGALAGFVMWEASSSTLQAKFLTGYAAKMRFEVKPGASPSVRFPDDGPYDIRFGYTRIPAFTKRLEQQGFEIASQARISPAMAEMADTDLFLPYHEKTQDGLTIYGANGSTLFKSRTPQRVFKDFAAVPPLVRDTLLFIENRELLTTDNPHRNPAVEWDRLAQAILDKLIQAVNPSHSVPGGSTLATQIEKYRHSPDGLTLEATDKLKQMASGSVRAYLDGNNTMPTRRRLVLDYLNTVPLSAAPGFGEVIGLPDALWAWYGQDYRQVSKLLIANVPDADTAAAYKHVLSLLIAQRKPSFYLVANHKALDEHTDIYLRLLANQGLISPALRDAALKVPLHFNIQRPVPNHDFVEQKATNAIRARLAALLGVPGLYDVDRLDLSANSTLNGTAQAAVSRFLVSLNTPEGAKAVGMFGKNLLNPDNDLTKIIYSFTLYENTPQGALLRIQADNLNQPFDLNRGAKLDLGSTAKLRTLISYLEIVTKLHARYATLPAEQLRAIAATDTADAIAQWSADYVLHNPGAALQAMLEAAMDRVYSADPSTLFFTGGGAHRFVNFNKADNGRRMNLWEATRNSVNLVYIRLMRDIARHYISETPGAVGRILEDANNPARKTYLERFADQEGQAFLLRFHKKYRGLNPAQVTEKLFASVHPTPRRLAAVYRYLAPNASVAEFAKFLRSRAANGAALPEREVETLYSLHSPDAYSLADRGYIAQIHPLELWLVRYLRSHPTATFADTVAASHDQRIEVYNWLFKTSRKNAQDVRIHSLLEVEAFQQIYLDWKRLGYPFDSLVPSYATAIGSSADRPAALAELMGIVVNNGVRLPAVSLEKLHFAAGTPYDTSFTRKQPKGERLLPAELTVVVRRALQGVVEQGTASRLKGAFKDADGKPIIMGGKTGTGDHRYETFDSAGNVLTSRVVNRTATMVFFLGDRFFGTMTALVPGEEAAKYRFTSSLPSLLIKAMSPALAGVLAPLEHPAKPAATPTPRVELPAKPIKPVESTSDQAPDGVPDDTLVTPPAAPERELKPSRTLSVPASKPDSTAPAIPASAPAPLPSLPNAQPPAPIEERRPEAGEAY